MQMPPIFCEYEWKKIRRFYEKAKQQATDKISLTNAFHLVSE